MSRALQSDALRLIQDIVRESKGSPLDREAVRRVEAVLKALAGGGVSRGVPDTAYSAREATIVFADLRGFSAIASAHPADVVLGMLNRCFTIIVDIIVGHYGTIDKFMGDAIMAIFYGEPDKPRDHARRAVLCAVELQNAMHQLRERHRGERATDVYLGVGINTGHMVAGLVGSEAYRAYTVIGDEVNLAARIEAISLRGQVLMSEATYEHCKDFVHAGEPMDAYVKGRADRVRMREALGIPSLGKVVPRQDARKSPRAPVRLGLQYWRLEGKIVAGAAAHGLVRDISYHGLLAELPEPVPLYAELKLAFDLAPLEFSARQVYGRIVSVRAHEAGFLCGVEFTSLGAETAGQIQVFVQAALQDQAGHIA